MATKRPIIRYADTGRYEELRVGDSVAGSGGSASLTWDYLVTTWSAQPSQIGSTASGLVYSYTLAATTRYRLVPNPYTASSDSFYSTWDGTVLSDLINTRGVP